MKMFVMKPNEGKSSKRRWWYVNKHGTVSVAVSVLCPDYHGNFLLLNYNIFFFIFIIVFVLKGIIGRL